MKNWRTTIAMYSAALPALIFDLADAYEKGQFDGKHGVGALACIALIIFGHVSKDAVVSGKGL